MESEPKADPEVRSPCIRVCRLNPRGECFGCFRTSEEILQWARLDPSDRRLVVEQAERRKLAYWADRTPVQEP